MKTAIVSGAVANKCGISDIPNEVSHLKNEVIIQKDHRYGYDQALFCAGVSRILPPAKRSGVIGASWRASID